MSHRLRGAEPRGRNGRGGGRRLTFVVQPFVDGVRHVEGEPFPFCSGFHDFAVDVALGRGR